MLCLTAMITLRCGTESGLGLSLPPASWQGRKIVLYDVMRTTVPLVELNCAMPGQRDRVRNAAVRTTPDGGRAVDSGVLEGGVALEFAQEPTLLANSSRTKKGAL